MSLRLRKKRSVERFISSNEKQGERWCITEDFNATRNSNERKWTSATNRRKEMVCFDNFIMEAGLIDLPLCGRKYTWYRADGLSMSRIDRIVEESKR